MDHRPPQGRPPANELGLALTRLADRMEALERRILDTLGIADPYRDEHATPH
jgi:hypothetical protein